MKEAAGDFALAAAGLGRSESAIRNFVLRDQQLSAIWLRDSAQVTTPGEGEIETRTFESSGVPQLPHSNPLGEAMLQMNREALRTGLQAAGIGAETINKLGLFESFGPNTGAFLAAGLDITHKMTLFQGVSLFEQAEYIKKHYLDNETLSVEMRLEWSRVYTEMSEQVGKTSDRLLVATQAAVAMMKKKEEGESGGKGEKVVGFQPLKARPAK